MTDNATPLINKTHNIWTKRDEKIGIIEIKGLLKW